MGSGAWKASNGRCGVLIACLASGQGCSLLPKACLASENRCCLVLKVCQPCGVALFGHMNMSKLVFDSALTTDLCKVY
jgi:hypothetical protein